MNTRTLNRVEKALRAAVAATVVAAHAVSLGAAAVPMAANAQLSLPTGSAFAPDEPPAAFIAQRGRGMSLSQATAIATSQFRGRLVKAETVEQGGRVIHVIRILGDDGRVRTVRIDAESGAVM